MEDEVLTDELLDEEEDTQKGKYMTFGSSGESYGIALQYINEIIGIQPITKIPEVEGYIKGLINLRGKIIPVVDVRLRFRQEPLEYTDRTCIIIIQVKNVVVGLIIEKIEGVVAIEDSNIEPPPSLSAGRTKNHYIYGIGKVDDSVILLLEPQKLIRDEEIELFEELADNEEDEG